MTDDGNKWSERSMEKVEKQNDGVNVKKSKKKIKR